LDIENVSGSSGRSDINAYAKSIRKLLIFLKKIDSNFVISIAP
jgi:hypothetical protein